MLLTLEGMRPLDIVRAVVDILIVAYLLYRIFLILRGTRAMQLLKGILLLVVATQVSSLMALSATHYLLQAAQVALLVAIPVVFQPELRRVLEQIGRSRIFGGQGLLHDLTSERFQRMLDQVVKAAHVLAADHTGALIVLERETGLKDIVETGVHIEAVISWELLVNIFSPRTPLHDGAVVARGDRLVAAACFLPLADSPDLSSDLGTRHRAALGVSEQSDAVAVIVSEESGAISIADGGQLIRHLDDKALRRLLETALRPPRERKLLNMRRA